MDDTPIQRFFTHPTQTYHRQYEALRAVIVDGRSQKDAADAFGFEYSSLRQLMGAFRRHCDETGESAESPFFAPCPSAVRPPARKKTPSP
jgi:hypothetical protein